MKSFGQKLIDYFSLHPLFVSLSLAFVVRGIASLTNHGPGAIDDYTNIIGPALKLIQTGEPPALTSLRFDFLPYLFYYFMLPFHRLGVENAGYLVSGGYFILSLVSLVQVWGMYRVGGVYLNKQWRNLFTLVGSMHFAFSFFMTRAYLSSFAIITIIWGIYWLKTNHYFLSGLMFSLTVLFRFTLAPVYFVVWIYILRYSITQARITQREHINYLTGGLSTASLMVILEVCTGHKPFETVIQFFTYNINAHVTSQSYGSMAWFTYFGILLLIFIPPVSIILLKPLFKASFKLKLPFSILLVVLLPHTFLPYKLERFIVPIFSIYILITMYGLQTITNVRLYHNAFYVFLWLNLPMTIIIAMSGSQMGATSGLMALGQEKGEKYISGIHPVWWGYYGYNKPHPKVERDINKIIQDTLDNKISSFYLLNFLNLAPHAKSKLQSQNIICDRKKTFKPSLGESMVIWLNPKFNQRRRETVLYFCHNIKN